MCVCVYAILFLKFRNQTPGLPREKSNIYSTETLLQFQGVSSVFALFFTAVKLYSGVNSDDSLMCSLCTDIYVCEHMELPSVVCQ